VQSERRSRLAPIVKKVVMAVAVKKGIDMFQEARRPKKRSFLGRLAKLGMWTAGGAGLFYAFANGKLQPIVDKVMGASSSSGYSDTWSSPSTTSSAGTPSSSPTFTSSGEGNLSSSSTSSTTSPTKV
jgi:hypothetical protein